MQNSTLFIVGSGAVGKALAVSLKRAGKKVVLLRGSVDDGSAYQEKIQIITHDKTILEESIEVSTLSNYPALDGIIVLTNKSYGNTDLARALKEKAHHSPVVILQNGLGIEQPFIDHHFPAIYRCVLFVTSQTLPENKVSFKPVSASLIGAIKENGTELNAIVDQLNTPGFPFKAETNIQKVIWRKAIINCVFNSICPLLEIDNGIFHRDASVLAMAKRVILECIGIATEKGISLTLDEVVENLLLISRTSDGQLISTLQDIRNKRRTEIDTLNFAIVNIAKALNREDSVKETRLLGELTKLKSENIL
jgi:2-dehydropantoate 2-reductase